MYQGKEVFTRIDQKDIVFSDDQATPIIDQKHRAFVVEYDLGYEYKTEIGLSDAVIDLCERLAIYASECSEETNAKHEKAAQTDVGLYELAKNHAKLNPKVGAILLRAKPGSSTCDIYGCCRGAFDLDNHAEYSLITHALGAADDVFFTQDDYFFTTLEPCTQNARNKWSCACAKLLEQRKVRHLFIGLMDPNVLITGRGYYQLFLSGKEYEIEITPFKYCYRKVLCDSNRAYLNQYSRDNPIHLAACRDIYLAYHNALNYNAINRYIQLANISENEGDGSSAEWLLSMYQFLESMLERRYIVPSRAIDPYSLKKEFALFFCDTPKQFVDGATIMIYADAEFIRYDGPLSLFFDGAFAEDDHLRRKSLVQIAIEHYGDDDVLMEWKRQPDLAMRENVAKAFFKTIGLDLISFREAVLNALAHRDYSSGIFTEVRLSDDYISVRNPLPRHLSKKQIKAIADKRAISNPMNPLLMRLFMDIEATERRAFGMGTFRDDPSVAVNVDDEPFVEVRFAINGKA